MGEIFKPEDLVRGKRGGSKDIPHIVERMNLESLIDEVRRLREEVERIKRALERHGIEIH